MATDQNNQDRSAKAVELLLKAGCRCLNTCTGPKTFTKNRLEFWGVPNRGVVILEIWEDGSVSSFADWPLGTTWEDFEKAIQPATV